MSKLTGKRKDLGNGLVAVEINKKALQQQGATLQEAFSNALKIFDKKKQRQSRTQKHRTESEPA